MRKIQSPGIEIHEIDNSQYINRNTNTLTDTAVLITGFTDRGQEYTTERVDSIFDFNNKYGVPTNEAERYMWNAVSEVLGNGGIAYCSKLPYYNQSFEKYTYTVYNVENSKYNDKTNKYATLKEIPYPKDQFEKQYTVEENSGLTSYYESESSYKDLITFKKLNPIGTKLLDLKYKEVNYSNPNISFINDFLNFITQNCYIDYDDQTLFKEAFTSLEVFNMLDSLMLSEPLSIDIPIPSFTEINEHGERINLLPNPSFISFYDDAQSTIESINRVRESLLETFGPIEYVEIDGEKYPKSPTDKIINQFIVDKTVNNLKDYYDDFYNNLKDIVDVLNSPTNNSIIEGFRDYTLEVYSEKHGGLVDTELYRLEGEFGINDFDTSVYSFDGKNIILTVVYDNFLEYTLVFDSFSFENANYDCYSTTFTNDRYSDIRLLDSSLSDYIYINSGTVEEKDNPKDEYVEESKTYTGTLTFNEFDTLKTGSYQPITKIKKNQFMIVDISRQKYKKDINDNECVAIIPVVTTSMNAIYYQELLKNSENMVDSYNSISRMRTVFDKIYYQKTKQPHTDLYREDYYDAQSSNNMFSMPLNSQLNKSGVSDVADSLFPSISYISEGKLDRNYLKQIGIVVFAIVMDGTSKNKITFQVLESFVGSLKKGDKDFTTGYNCFIDDIVNNSSNYINVFSNVEFGGIPDVEGSNATDKCSMYMIKDQTVTSLGFYESQSEKQIHLKKSIFDSIDLIFNANKDRYGISLDIILDGGISNIAQYIKSVCKKLDYTTNSECGYYDINDVKSRAYTMDSLASTSTWNQYIRRLDNFCKNIRKDCMFIADMPRPFCLEGNQKIVRKTKPSNTIANDILPKLKYAVNVSTSYGAGYSNWFYVLDRTTNEYFWCPPSIKTVGSYLYTDAYYNYWDAPAGMNRGKVQNAFDIAFNPSNDESGNIYKNNWNYAVNYPIDGIVIEGQKTFQIAHTALDRVNIRRMLLFMEKRVASIARRYVYEQNTEWLRERFVDDISQIFEYAVTGGGISEYVIVCNEKNNTPETIDNHELHCVIAIRPIKSLEYIILDFIALPQESSFTERELLNMTNNL